MPNDISLVGIQEFLEHMSTKTLGFISEDLIDDSANVPVFSEKFNAIRWYQATIASILAWRNELPV